VLAWGSRLAIMWFVRTTESKAAAAARIGAGLAARKRGELLDLIRPCFVRCEAWLQAGKYVRVRARLRACWTVHSPVGFAVTPRRCIRRVPCSMNTRTYSRFSSTVSTCRKSTARIPAAWACRNCRQVGPARRGAGPMPAARRIS
jgi:hypothetical protein